MKLEIISKRRLTAAGLTVLSAAAAIGAGILFWYYMTFITFMMFAAAGLALGQVCEMWEGVDEVRREDLHG